MSQLPKYSQLLCHQNWDIRMNSHQLYWAGIIFQVTTGVHCCYQLKFSPCPMCLLALLTILVFRVCWIPASWLSSKLLLLSSSGEHNSCVPGFAMICVITPLFHEDRQCKLPWGFHVKRGCQGAGQNLHASCTTYKVSDSLTEDGQQENSRRLSDCFPSLSVLETFCCAHWPTPEGIDILSEEGVWGQAQSLPFSSIFVVNMQQLKH